MGILWWIRCGSQEDQEQIIIHSHTSTSATEWISLPFPFSKSAEHSLNLDGRQLCRPPFTRIKCLREHILASCSALCANEK